jgi:hypothetical protein
VEHRQPLAAADERQRLALGEGIEEGLGPDVLMKIDAHQGPKGI